MVVKIGHVGPTSGGIAHLGKDNENGARMAIDELNAKGVTIGGKKAKFELVAEDDAGDPKQGTAVANKLVDAKVNGVIGHLNSGTSIPASKVYSDAGIPQISPSATNPKYTRQGFKTTFRVVADDVHLGGTLGRYAVKELKGKSIVTIDDRTAYGQGVAEEFAKAVKASGGAIADTQFTTDKATDFTCHPDRGQGEETRHRVLRRHGRRRRTDDPPDEATRHHCQVPGRRWHLLRRTAEAGGRRDGGRSGRVRRSGWRRGYAEGWHGQVPRRLQEEVQRRCADLCPVRLRRGQRDGRRDGEGQFGGPEGLPAGPRQDGRLQGRDRQHLVRRKGDVKNGALTLYTYKGDKREQMAVVR
jgi:branched-chain amino acid transport system substrate-binding protein